MTDTLPPTTVQPIDPRSDLPPAAYGCGQTKQGDIRAARIEVIATADDKVNTTEPPSHNHAQEGTNKVYQSEAGHIWEFDDTPGAERICIQHANGTFWEIHPTGDQVCKVFGKDFEIALSDKNLVVGGALNVTCQGDATFLVAGNVTEKIGGNKTTIINGDHITRVGGKTLHYSKGDINVQSSGNVSVAALVGTVSIAAKTTATVSGQTTNIIGSTKATLSGQAVGMFGETSTTFNNGSASLSLSSGTVTMSGTTVNIVATGKLTTWGGSYGSSGNGGGVVAQPPSGPINSVLTATVPASLDPTAGLTIPSSLISPSLESQFAGRTDNPVLVPTLDPSLTYPKDRVKNPN
jgi:hypothetical protein